MISQIIETQALPLFGSHFENNLLFLCDEFPTAALPYLFQIVHNGHSSSWLR